MVVGDLQADRTILDHSSIKVVKKLVENGNAQMVLGNHI